MTRHRIVFSGLVAILSLTAIAATSLAQDEPASGKQVSQKMISQADPNSSLSYWEFLPKDYGTDNREWPVMLFLHGAGERGDDLKLVKFHGPPKLVDQRPDFPFIVISPQCPKDHWWPGDVQQHLLAELLDDVLRRFKVDRQRITITGLSMGGFGTWEMTARYPHVFSAAVPICGRGDPDSGAKLKNVPFWVFHGAKDFGVPLRYSEQMVEVVKNSGGKAKLTVYPDAGHDSWTETYNNNAVYEWMLEQRAAQPVKLPIASTEIAFSIVGEIKTPVGDPSANQQIHTSIYLSAPRSSSVALRNAVEKNREQLLALMKAKLISRSFNDLRGLAGMRRAQSDLSSVAQQLFGSEAGFEARALLDLYFISQDKRLQLDP